MCQRVFREQTCEITHFFGAVPPDDNESEHPEYGAPLGNNRTFWGVVPPVEGGGMECVLPQVAPAEYEPSGSLPSRPYDGARGMVSLPSGTVASIQQGAVIHYTDISNRAADAPTPVEGQTPNGVVPKW